MKCPECTKYHQSLCAVVAALRNANYSTALTLARVGMHGGSVNNPLDCADPTRHNNTPLNGDHGKRVELTGPTKGKAAFSKIL